MVVGPCTIPFLARAGAGSWIMKRPKRHIADQIGKRAFFVGWRAWVKAAEIVGLDQKSECALLNAMWGDDESCIFGFWEEGGRRYTARLWKTTRKEGAKGVKHEWETYWSRWPSSLGMIDNIQYRYTVHVQISSCTVSIQAAKTYFRPLFSQSNSKDSQIWSVGSKSGLK